MKDLLLAVPRESAKMFCMAPARIAAIALALFPCAALCQRPAVSSLTVTVTDQAGALIPGAHVTAIKAESGLRIEAIANPGGPLIGQATLKMEPGIYTLRVQASAFKPWEETNVELTTDLRRTVSLAIDNNQQPCTLPCDPFLQPVIPEEHPQLTAEVPLMTLQQLDPPAKRLRSRSHSPNRTNDKSLIPNP